MTWLAWGASGLATGGAGLFRTGHRRQNPAGANSSTMKGPQGLASESCERRCQTANGHRRWVRGCFYVRSPEITDSSGGNGAGSGEPGTRRWPLRVTPDSDVTRKAEDMANAGNPTAAGVVPGARPGKPGDRNAAGWECGLSRSRPGGRAMPPAGQWGLVRSPRVVPGVDDERADGMSKRSDAPPAARGRPLGRRGRLQGTAPGGGAP